MAKLKNQDGQLNLNHANIANHLFTLDFLSNIPDLLHNLPHHIARKKIPFYDLEKGEIIIPSIPNGIKYELFIFDVFKYAKNMLVCEVVRENEFSPLKNAKGCYYLLKGVLFLC